MRGINVRGERLRAGVHFPVIDGRHSAFRVRNTRLPHPLRHERNRVIADPDAGRMAMIEVEPARRTV